MALKQSLVRNADGKPAQEQYPVNGWHIMYSNERFQVCEPSDHRLVRSTFQDLRNARQYAKTHKPGAPPNEYPAKDNWGVPQNRAARFTVTCAHCGAHQMILHLT